MDTRLDIIRQAEQLFAEKGVDGASLTAIAAAAGQRNRSAVHYHFGTRRGLVEAILERHSGPVQERWIEPLAMLERENLVTLERLVGLIVSSLMRAATNPDGGTQYIIIARQLLVHPTLSLMSTRMVGAEGATKMAMALVKILTVPAPFIALWSMRVAHVLFHSIGDYQRYGPAHLTQEDFESDLVGSIVALLRRQP